MKSFSNQRPLLNQLLPAILLPIAFLAGTHAAKAPQAPPDASAGSPPQGISGAQEPPITAEDIGDSLLVKRSYQEAIEQYKKMTPQTADLWNKMGIAYQMLFDLKDAARCYKASLRLNPAHGYALNNMGTIYDAQSDFRKAEGFYRKAVEVNPESARSAMNLGTNLMTQRRYSEGSEMYKRALALDPEVFDTSEGPISENGVPIEQRGAMNYYKAKDYAQAGMIDRALKFLKKALNEGFASPADVAQDTSFAGLRHNPAFKRMMAERAQQSTAPQPAPNDKEDSQGPAE